MKFFHKYQYTGIVLCTFFFLSIAQPVKNISQASRPTSMTISSSELHSPRTSMNVNLPMSFGDALIKNIKAQEATKNAANAPLLLKKKVEDEAEVAIQQSQQASSTFQRQLEQAKRDREKAEAEAERAKIAQAKAEAEANQAKIAQARAEAEADAKIQAKIAEAEAEQARKEQEKAEIAVAEQAKAVAEAQKPAYKSMPHGLEREQAKKAYIESLSPEAKVIFSQKEVLEEKAEKSKRERLKEDIKSAAGGGALGLGGTGAATLAGLAALEATGVTNFIPDDDAPATASGQAGQNISISIGDTSVGSRGTSSPNSSGSDNSDTIALIDE